jgi:hypothetical protein
VLGAAREGALEVLLQSAEGGEAIARELVAQVVGEAREAVEGEQVPARRCREDAQRDGEVLAAGAPEDLVGKDRR